MMDRRIKSGDDGGVRARSSGPMWTTYPLMPGVLLSKH